MPIICFTMKSCVVMNYTTMCKVNKKKHFLVYVVIKKNSKKIILFILLIIRM